MQSLRLYHFRRFILSFHSNHAQADKLPTRSLLNFLSSFRISNKSSVRRSD
ncbi:hypothetical protein C7S16_4783 [Burkholderia thailandensis]|uniref:Uncharacterized protein n=1 Tax=Burkholderia thailandensis TaxID=57975 RepID=A0AAW9CRN0_BURTH|nr:hypothetical protein [Burkholderia thailandensis]